MVLIADSGSTKCDWVLVDGDVRHDFSTMGFNPFFHNEEIICNAIKNNTEFLRIKFIKNLRIRFYFFIKDRF